jgi:hypothetical protein
MISSELLNYDQSAIGLPSFPMQIVQILPPDASDVDFGLAMSDTHKGGCK